jgi:hypothetical protein
MFLPFENDFQNKVSIYSGFFVAMFDYRRVLKHENHNSHNT